MISLNGKLQRQFFFPSDPYTTYEYLSNLGQIIQHLPHTEVEKIYDANSVRIHYQTIELGTYTIGVICDLECMVVEDDLVIRIRPVDGILPPSANASLNATTGYGYYSSEASLYPLKNGTGIDYKLHFEAKLLRPRGLRMMPRRVVERIAKSISKGRVTEMAEGFMMAAIEAFPEWQKRQGLEPTQVIEPSQV